MKFSDDGTHLVDQIVANPENVFTWDNKPIASEYTGSAWFSDVGAMGYSDGVSWKDSLDLDPFDNMSTDRYLAYTGVVLSPFTVYGTKLLNRIRGSVGITHAGALIEIGVYDSGFNLLATTEQRNIPGTGVFEFAHPQITLSDGIYYYALSTNSTSATFGSTDKFGGYKKASVLPLTATLEDLEPSNAYPALKGCVVETPVISNFAELIDDGYRWYGKDNATGRCYGWLNSPSKIVYTDDGGVTVSQLMSAPSTGGSFIVDIHVYNGKMYVLAEAAKIYMSSDLTAGATWTTITCPATSGLRRSYGTSRTYGIMPFNDYLLYGEYSSGTNELANDPTDPGPPRILKYGPLSGSPSWTLSLQTSNARHIHSLNSVSSNELFASVGDGSYGAGIGLYKLTDVVANTWVQISSTTSPFTSNYPVDFVIDPVGIGCAAGIYGAGDKVGKWVMYAKHDGITGKTNISTQLWKENANSGETSRSIIIDFDGNRNMYWFTAETADPALYVSPPPYTQAYRLAANAGTISRSVISNGYLLNGQKRYKIAKFSGQSDTHVAASTPVDLKKSVTVLQNNAGYMVASLAAANAATYTADGSRKIVVSSTGHAIPSTQNGANIYLPILTGDAPIGWFSDFTYIDANSFSCVSPTLVTTNGTITTNTSSTQVTPLDAVIPGGLMGKNGRVQYSTLHMQTNSANTKTLLSKFGGTTLQTLALAAFVTVWSSLRSIANRNSYSKQIAESAGTTTGGATTSAPAFSSIDTSVDATLSFWLQCAAANEYMTLHSVNVAVIPAD